MTLKILTYCGPLWSLPEMPQWTSCVNNVSSCESPTALEPAVKEVVIRLPVTVNEQHQIVRSPVVTTVSPDLRFQISGGKVMEELQILEKLTKELRAIDRTLSMVLDGREDETKPRYWTRVARRLNKAFFVFYLTVVTLFLIFITLKWMDALD